MAVKVQVVTTNSKIIEKARWSINSTSFPLQEKSNFALSFPTSDRNLLTYLAKARSMDFYLESSDVGLLVYVKCVIDTVDHLLDTQTSAVESIIIVKPISRHAESIILYLIDPALCEPRFLASLRH